MGRCAGGADGDGDIVGGFQMDFGKIIKEARIRQGMTQLRLAEETGIHSGLFCTGKRACVE